MHEGKRHGPGTIINEKKKRLEKLSADRNVLYSQNDIQEAQKRIINAHSRFENNNNADSPGDGQTIKRKDDNQQWKIPNPLHKFATYTTLFTLSALTETEIVNPEKIFVNPLHDIIARSGGIGDKNRYSTTMASRRERNSIEPFPEKRKFEAAIPGNIKDSREILKRNRDIFFENVNILSTVAPNENRNSMNFTKMEFELHEPYGVTFVEKVRAAAFNSGYLDYADAPFLLTIEWKGFDEHSRPIRTGDSLIRRIPILLSRVEFTVNEGGTVYTIIAVPYNDFALMDRYNMPRNDGTVKAKYLTQHKGHGRSTEDSDYWDEQVIALLNTQMKNETAEGVRMYWDEYKITFDEQILKQGFTTSYAVTTALKSKSKGYKGIKISSGASGKFQNRVVFAGSSTKISSKIHLSRSIEDAVRSLNFYKELTVNFWETYFKKVVNPTTFNSQGAGGIESINNVGAEDVSKWLDPEHSKQLAKVLALNPMVPWFKVLSSVETEARLDPITKMHPKKIKFHVVPYYIHILKLSRAGISFGNVDWGRFVRKHFNYIYTGENVDVQNLRIEYKVGYWMKNVRQAAPDGIMAKIQNKITEQYQRLFGKELEKAMMDLRQYPSTESDDNVSYTENKFGSQPDQFWDYLTNPQADMMRIELEILGDPGFLSQDMYTTLAKDNKTISARGDGKTDWNDIHKCFNIDSVMPTIGVNYRMPGDIDLQSGLMFNPKQTEVESNIFFNGVYQVNKVESRINNGQFTQILYCTRLNNQTGTGVSPDIHGIGFTKQTEELIKKNSEEGDTQTIDSGPMFGEGIET